MIYLCSLGPQGTIRGEGTDMGKRNRCGKKLQRIKKFKKEEAGHRQEKARGLLGDNIGNEEAGWSQGELGACPRPCGESEENSWQH